MTVLTLCSAGLTVLTVGAMAGIFFGFSVAVLPGLDGVDADQAVAAMRSVNRRILNPLFLSAFVGAPVLAAATGVLLFPRGQRAAAVLFLLAAGVYLLGAFLPTAAVNVPMNDALAAAGTVTDPAEAARLWAEYSPRWTRWNSLRAAACALSLLLAALALYLWGRRS